jgi:hypothetical protein
MLERAAARDRTPRGGRRERRHGAPARRAAGQPVEVEQCSPADGRAREAVEHARRGERPDPPFGPFDELEDAFVIRGEERLDFSFRQLLQLERQRQRDHGGIDPGVVERTEASFEAVRLEVELERPLTLEVEHRATEMGVPGGLRARPRTAPARGADARRCSASEVSNTAGSGREDARGACMTIIHPAVADTRPTRVWASRWSDLRSFSTGALKAVTSGSF